MANVYYSTQWDGLEEGTVVKVKGDTTAVIGTDAFSDYSEAKAAGGDIVLCDVFSSSAWASEAVGGKVTVTIEGDTYTLTVGEEAFATLEAAAMQVATNQYGGVETYGDNDGVTAYGYVSGAWSDLPDYTVVTTGSTVWDEDGAVVTGGTAVIGVTAFATYTEANDKLDVYWNESQLNGVAASSDIYLNSTWDAGEYSEGETITVTLGDGSEVTATFGENAVLLPDDASATTVRASVKTAAESVKASGGALYFTGGTFLSPGTNWANDYFYTYGAKTVIANTSIPKAYSGGQPSDDSSTAVAPEVYILSGGKVGNLLVAGRKSTETASLYVGVNGYVGSVQPAYEGTYQIVDVLIDGGTFNEITGANNSGTVIAQEYNVTVDGGTGTKLWVGASSGQFRQLKSDVNFTVKGGGFVNTIDISSRSVTSGYWYQSFNVQVQDFTVTIDDATVKNVTNSGNSYWSFESYNIVLDGGTISNALNPSGNYSAGTLAYNGGTATITGGTFVTSFTDSAGSIVYGDENTETVWSDGVYRYLAITGLKEAAKNTTVTKNADGSVTVKNGVYYNKDAASGKQWIQGGTATFANGSQNQFTISVTGNQESYIKAFASMESIVVDATAQLTTTSSIVSGRSITIDATGFEFATGVDEKLVISAGSITTSDITIVAGGTVSNDFALRIDGGDLYITKRYVIYSAGWMNKADGETVVYSGCTYTIGTDAFGDYGKAQEAAGEDPVVLCDIYLDTTWVEGDYQEGDSVPVTLDGIEAYATLGENAILLKDATATSVQTGVTAAAAMARAKGSAIYLNSGTFLHTGTDYSGATFTDGCKVVVSNSYVKRIANGKSTKGVAAATPETYVLSGARVGEVWIGYGTADKASIYVAEEGFVSYILGSRSGTFKTIDVVIDGGTFGTFRASDGGATITDAINVNANNATKGELWLSSVNGSGLNNGLACDVNYTLNGSSLTTIAVACRSCGGSEWYRCYNTTIGDFTIDLTDSTVSDVISNSILSSFWCFKSYSVILDHSTVTTLAPTSGGYASLAILGGTATVTGGTFVTTVADAPVYGDENVESVWSNGDFRYLMLSTATKTVNADGSITIVGGVYYNDTAEAGKKWIQGGTATIVGGTQSKFSLTVKGNDISYVDTLSGIEPITIDATAQLSLGSSVTSGVSITVDATDFILEGASKTVLTTTGSISTTDLTILENGVKSEKYVLSINGKKLEIIARPTIYSAKWAKFADGEVVTYQGTEYTIGVDAFGNYATAKATGKEITICDKYYNPGWSGETGTVYVVLDGETVGLAMGTDAFDNLTTARAAAVNSAALVITGMTVSWSGRNKWDTPPTTILNDSRISASATPNGALITLFDGGMTIPGYDATFTVGKDSYLTSLGATGNDGNPTSVNSITYNVIDGGSSDIVYIIGYGKNLTATVNINVADGGVVNNIYPAYSGGTINGDVNIDVTGGTVVKLQLASQYSATSTITDGHDVNITLDNALISTLSSGDADHKMAKGEGSTFNITVTGNSTTTVSAWNCSTIDTLTIAANATLINTSNFSNYKNTITVDAANCDYTQGQYLILSASCDFTNDYVVVNADPVKGAEYQLVKDGKKLYYQKKPSYFSAGWAGLEDGTVVKTPAGTATIGDDAFATYDEAVASGRPPMSADVYFNYEWATLTTGDEVTVTIPGGSFTAQVSTESSQKYTAFTTLENAQKSYRTDCDDLPAVYITGGTTTGVANERIALSRKKTIITNTSIITRELLGAAGTALTGGTTCIVIGTGSSVTDVYAGGREKFTGDAQVFVLDNAKVSSLYGAGTSCDGAGTVLLSVDGGTTRARVSSIYGGGTGAFDGNVTISVKNAYGSTIYGGGPYSGSKSNGDVTISLEGATYTTVKAGAGNGYLGDVTAGTATINLKDSYIVGNDNGLVTFDGDYSARTTITHRYLNVNGGSVREIIGFAAKSGTLDADITNFTGLRFIAVNGGTATGDVNLAISNTTFTDYMALTVGASTIDGNASISVTDSYITTQLWITQAAGTVTGKTTLNLAGGTVMGGIAVNGAVTGGFEVNVTKDSYIVGGLTAKMTALNIDVDATLTLTGSIGYTGTITVDAANCEYTEDRYLIVSAAKAFDNAVELINVDPEKGAKYELVKVESSLYYQKKKVIYSALWRDKQVGEIITYQGVDFTIGTDAFANYNDAREAAQAQSKTVFDLDTYTDPTWVAGSTVTIQAQGGSYTAVVSDTARATTNAFTTKDIATTAHTKYFAAGGIVIDGATVTARTYLDSTQAKPYILKNYIATGGGDQGVCLSYGDKEGNCYGGYVIVGEGSKISAAYMGNRNYTTRGDFKLDVVDGGSITSLYAGGMYEGQLGAAEDFANVTFTIKDATVNQIYGTGCYSTSYAYVTVNVENSSGTLIYGGGPNSNSYNDGTMTLNLTNASYTGSISYRNITQGVDPKAQTNGAFKINVLGGTVSVGGMIILRNDSSDAITIDADALLVTSGVYTSTAKTAYTGTITVDATDFDLGSEVKKLVFKQTAADITVSFDLIDTTGKYIILKQGREVYVTTRVIAYSTAWKDKSAGELVVVKGNSYTIGTDAFGDYNDALTAAQSLSGHVETCDAYYSSEWATKSEGETVYVVLDGNTVAQTIGKNAFTSQSAAYAAMDSSAAVVFEGGSYSGTEKGSFQLGGKRTIFEGGTYSGYVFAGTTSGSISTVDLTVNNAIVGTLAINRYAVCTGTADIHVSGGSVSSLMTGSGSTDTCVTTILVDNNAKIGGIAASTAGNSNTINVTIQNASVTGYLGGAGTQESSHVTGDVNFTFSDATVNLFSAGRGTSFSQWKGSRVKGDVTVTVNGTASNFVYFDVTKYVANSMTVTVDADTTLTATEFYATSGQTITIDVDGFAFGESENSHTVISAGNSGLTKYNFVTTGTALDDYYLTVTSKAVTLNKKDCYFSSAWIGLETGTIVTTPSGTVATIGTDAFGLYADAKAAVDTHRWNLKSADRYFDYAWKDLTEGDEVTIVSPSGTFSTTIGDSAIPAYTTLDAAKTAAKAENTTLAMVGGSWTMDGRNDWYGITDTVMTNSTITGSANGGIVTMMPNRHSAAYESTFTVGEGGYLSSIAITGNDDGSTFNKITYNVNDGGRVGTLFLVGYAGSINGDLTVNMDGGTVNTSYIGASGGTVNGTVNVSMKDAKIGSFYLAPQYSSTSTLADGASINLTLDNSTMLITDFDKAHTLTKGEGAAVNVAVEGTATSTIDLNSVNVDTLTIDVGATLAINTNWKYTGTITIDASTCDYSQVQYTLVTGTEVTNDITVINDDPAKDYVIIRDGNNVYYQEKPIYFSVTWAGLESGTKVVVAGETLTIGTDAFESYALAQATGKSFIYSADTYLNSTYNATDPIVLTSGYTATFNKDAFADSEAAVTQANTMGGALDVTGGSFTGIDASGVKVSFFNDVESGSISGQTLNAVIAKKEMTVKNVTLTGDFAAVTAGTVTGDVTVDLANSTMTYLTLAGNSATVTGKTTLDVTGGTVAIKNFAGNAFDVNVKPNATLAISDDHLAAYQSFTNNGTLQLTDESFINVVSGTFVKIGIIGGSGNIVINDSGSVSVYSAADAAGTHYYTATKQDNIYVDSSFAGKSIFDEVSVGGGSAFFGVNAFANFSDATDKFSANAVATVSGTGTVAGDYSGLTIVFNNTENITVSGSITSTNITFNGNGKSVAFTAMQDFSNAVLSVTCSMPAPGTSITIATGELGIVDQQELSVNGESWKIGEIKQDLYILRYNNNELSIVDKTMTRIDVSSDPEQTKWTNQNVTVTAKYIATQEESNQYSWDNTNWLSYTDPITVTDNKLLFFRAMDAATGTKLISATFSVHNIDKIAPTIKDVKADPTAWTNENVTVTATFADEGGSQLKESLYKIDDGEWQNYTDGVVMTANGTVYFKATDNAGNTTTEIVTVAGETVSSFSVTNIDKVQPTIDIQGLPTNWTNLDVTVTATFTDDLSGIAKQEYQINDGDWKPYTETLTIKENCWLSFRATDNAGNVKETKDNVLVDQIAPTITGVTPSTTAWTNQNVTITATYADLGGSQLKDSLYKIDYIGGTSTGWQTYTGVITVEQNALVTLKATDNAGNETEITGATVTNIDKVVPTITDITPSTTAWTNQNVTITANYADLGGSQLKESLYKIGDGGWQTYTGVITVEQNALVTLRATDYAGNVTDETYNVTNIDKIAPTIKDVKADPTTWTNQDVTVTAAFADEGGSQLKECFYKIGDGEWQAYGSGGTVTQNAIVYFKATDNAGNKTEITGATVTNIDKVQPTIDIAGLPTEWTNQDVTVTATFTDDLSGIAKQEYRINDDAWQEFTGTLTRTITENCWLSFRATDNAGNVKETKDNVLVDQIAPTITGVTSEKPQGTWTNQNVTVTATFADEGGSQLKESLYKIDDGEWQNYTDGVVMTANGTVYFKATDNAGNTTTEIVTLAGETVSSFSVTNIDKVVPTITDITPSTTAWTNQNVTITATYADLGGSQLKESLYKIGDGEWQTYTGVITVEQNALVTLRATDYAGNVTDETYNVTNIDKIAPTTTVTPSETAWTNQDVIITAVFADEGGSGIATQEFSFDKTVWATYTNALTIQENYREIYFRTTDVAGNTTTDIIFDGQTFSGYTVTNIDKIAPTISKPKVEFAKGGVAVTITTNFADPVDDRNRCSGLAKTLWSEDNTLPLSQWQTYTDAGITLYHNCNVYFVAIDNAGNITEYIDQKTGEAGISIDKFSAPTICITATLPNGTKATGWTNQTVTVTAQIYPNTKGAVTAETVIVSQEYSFDEFEWFTYNDGEEIYVSNYSTIYFRGEDSNGKSATGEYLLQIDKSAPTIEITGNTIQGTGTSTVSATFDDNLSGVDETKSQYRIGRDGEWHDYTGVITVNDGTFVEILAVDFAGNTGTANFTTAVQVPATIEAGTQYTTGTDDVVERNTMTIEKDGKLTLGEGSMLVLDGYDPSLTFNGGAIDTNDGLATAEKVNIASGNNTISGIINGGTMTVAAGATLNMDIELFESCLRNWDVFQSAGTINVNCGSNAVSQWDIQAISDNGKLALVNFDKAITNVNNLQLAGTFDVSFAGISGTSRNDQITFKSGSNVKFGAQGTTIDLGAGYNTLDFQNGASATVRSTVDNVNTVKVGNSSNVWCTDDIKFVDKTNAMLTVGSSSTLQARAIDFKAGYNTLNIGNNSTATVKGALNGANRINLGSNATMKVEGAVTATTNSGYFYFGNGSNATLGDVKFGNGNDQLIVGTGSTFSTDAIDFAGGYNTLNIGNNSTATVKGILNGANRINLGSNAIMKVEGAVTATTNSGYFYFGNGSNATLGDVKFGNGNDQLSTGCDSTLVTGAIDFAGGYNTLNIGCRTKATVAGGINGVNRINLSAGASNKHSMLIAGDVTATNNAGNFYFGNFTDTEFAAVSFGNWNDQLIVGTGSTLATDAIDFAGGYNTLNIGNNSNATVKGALNGANRINLGSNATMKVEGAVTATTNSGYFYFGNSSNATLGDVKFGNGSDQLIIGTGGTLATGAIDFAGGYNTLNIGNNSNATVKGTLNGANRINLGSNATMNVEGAVTATTNSGYFYFGNGSNATLGDVKFGNGNDQLSTGCDSTLVTGAVDFAGGYNTLNIGCRTKATVYGGINGVNRINLSAGASNNYTTFTADNVTATGSADYFYFGNYSKVDLDAIDMGAGNDTLIFGADSRAEIDDLDFGAGNDMLNIGRSTTLSVDTLDVAGLENLVMATGASLAIGDEDDFKAAQAKWSKYSAQIVNK